MSGLPQELRDLIESGPLVHLSTINADGSPQVSVVWVGLDGDDLLSGHMSWYAKLRNIARDHVCHAMTRRRQLSVSIPQNNRTPRRSSSAAIAWLIARASG